MTKDQFRRVLPYDDYSDGQAHFLQTNRDSVAKQNTTPLAVLYRSPSIAPHKASGNLLLAVQSIIGAGLDRLQNPQPEGLSTRGLKIVKVEASLGIFPALMLTNTLGLFSVSFAYYISALGYGDLALESLFILGLLLMFVPNMVRLLSSAPSRLERIYLLCFLGICFYFVQFTISPLRFSSFDEILHWRTADDILRTSHLFSENSMLPVSPYYPGLEIVTNAISSMTGLNTFYAGVLLIIASRLLMILSFFLFYEQITKSSRMAGIALLIYIANPHFLFFDVIYNYETLALPLATFLLYILTRYETADKDHRGIKFTAWIVLLAVTITHHMTDYTLDGLLILWVVVSLFRPSSRDTRIYLTATALFALFLSLGYAFLLPGNPAWGYLSSYFGSSFTELGNIIASTGRARVLFSNQNNLPIPIWDRLLMIAAVAIVSFCLPFGLLSLWKQHRHDAMAVTFGLASFTYPISQVFRFTTFGAEITDRAAAFLFLPIAFALTILITHFWPTRKLNWKVTSYITFALSVVFLGGVVVDIGPAYSNLPGPYMVVADMRSIEPEGIQAATWSLTYLGSNNRVATDRIDQMLMSTYGDQRIVTRLDDNVDVSPIFFSSLLRPNDIGTLQYGRIHYLVVDLHLSTSLPAEGVYFENDRPTSPISKEALTKFNIISKIDRIFDSGYIIFYDTGAFLNG